MRYIRFRAWDKRERTMRYDLTKIVFSSVNTKDIEQGQPIQVRFTPEDTTNEGLGLGNIYLMQFTGLHDKHGTEIYEGDICQVGGHKMDVRWLGAGLWLVKPEIPDVELTSNTTSNIEVVGNIYETPELLEGSKHD